jgi:hypothetical protein
MAQLFHPGVNPLARASVFGVVLAVGGAVWIGGSVARSPYLTDAHVIRDQPVPFSHKHHVGGIGIDCRYCHGAVEEGPVAGLPPTQTCMNCHSQIWADSPALEPVRRSFETGRPIRWVRVHDLPDFAYFDHSIHVRRGIDCARCHGRVEEMPLTMQDRAWFMESCLDCHREAPGAGEPGNVLLNCSTCHR